MRWFVEVSRVGEVSSAAKYCVQARQWQAALQAARKLRGDSGPLSKFSIELLDDGYRAVDPTLKVRYVVNQAPGDAPLTEEDARAIQSENGHATASANGASARNGSTNGAANGAHIAKPLAAVAPAAVAPAAVAPAAVAATSEPEIPITVSLPDAEPSQVEAAAPPAPTPAEAAVASVAAEPPPSVAAEPAPAPIAEVAAAPASAAHAAAEVPSVAPAASAIEVRVLRRRSEDPRAESPITYRELALAVDPSVTREQVHAVLLEHLDSIRSSLLVATGRFVHLAVFDHVFEKKPNRPPIATLVWKEWRGEPVLSFPGFGEASAGPVSGVPPKLVSLPPPPVESAPQAESQAAPAAANPAQPAPSVASEPDPAATPAPAAEAASAAAMPAPAAALGSEAEAMTESPSTVPESASAVASEAAPTGDPAAGPPPEVLLAPAASVDTASDASPGTSASSAPAPSEAPAYGAFPSVTNTSSGEPPAPTPASSEEPAPTPSAEPAPAAVSAEPAPTPARAEPPVTAALSAEQPARSENTTPAELDGSRRRGAGEDLISDLFETMHELRFMGDIAAGAKFTLGVIDQVLPCEGVLIHAFDINKGDFVVVRAKGRNPADALLERTPESDPLCATVMHHAEATIFPNVSEDARFQAPRWSKLGVMPRMAACGAIRLGGRYLGMVELVNPAGGTPFRENEINALDYICRQLAEFFANRPMVLEPDVILGRP